MEFASPAQFANLYGSDDISIAWFSEILSTIVSKEIEEIIFNLWGGDTEDPTETGDLQMIDEPDWDNVLAVLAEPPFHSLHRVSFHVSGIASNANAISEAMKRRFSRLDDIGILHFDSEEDSDCR